MEAVKVVVVEVGNLLVLVQELVQAVLKDLQVLAVLVVLGEQARPLALVEEVAKVQLRFQMGVVQYLPSRLDHYSQGDLLVGGPEMKFMAPGASQHSRSTFQLTVPNFQHIRERLP